MTESKRYIRVGFPLAILAICTFLWSHIARKGAALDAVPNAVGPGGWPRAMLVGLGVFAALALVAELLEWRRNIRSGVAAIPGVDGTEEKAGTSDVMAFAGVGVILAYGFSIPYLGFAFSTVAFIAVWCLMGRIRSWATIASVSIIGTVLLLYMFVALAKMPLNRGVEPFNSWTISLYRLLKIY